MNIHHTLYFEIAYMIVYLAVHLRWTLAAKPPFNRTVQIGFELGSVPGFSFVLLILVISRKTEYPRENMHQTHGIWPVNVQVHHNYFLYKFQYTIENLSHIVYDALTIPQEFEQQSIKITWWKVQLKKKRNSNSNLTKSEIQIQILEK